MRSGRRMPASEATSARGSKKPSAAIFQRKPQRGLHNRPAVQNAMKWALLTFSNRPAPPDGWTDVKCEKSNNDGLLDGWTVAKGGSGEKTQVRTARPKSDDHEIASPDDILDIPRFLDLRRCAHCNRNGALGQVALPDRPGTIWLHREGEGPWLQAPT